MAGRKKWNRESMTKAVEAVQRKEMGYLKASKIFGVPKGTIERYVRKGDAWEEQMAKKLGRTPVLPVDLEKLLVQYCIDMDRRFYGLRKADIRKMTFQLCSAKAIRNPFKNDIAGEKWLRGFFDRNPTLSLRKPQGMAHARIRGFTKENVDVFFDMFDMECRKINYKGDRIFNVDEKGICVVQNKHTKVVSLKGKKQVAAVQSQERGKLMTIVTCMNATGIFVPPLIVFPRKNMKDELMEGAPAGSISACHSSGWIQTDIFTRWFEHFLKFTKPSEDDPIVLVLDGHYSHTRNLDFINLARNNFVSVVCLPPHSSHKMQPLDVAFMNPLKTYYSQEIENWLRAHPGRVVNQYSIASMFGKAYNRAAGMGASVNGFRKTGLVPFNRNVFEEHEFTESASSSRLQEPPLPTTPKDASLNPFLNQDMVVTPEDISPLPVVTTAHSSRAGAAAVVTSTPYKTAIESAVQKKKEKEAKQLVNADKRANKKKKVVKRILFSDDDEEDNEKFSLHDSSSDYDLADDLPCDDDNESIEEMKEPPSGEEEGTATAFGEEEGSAVCVGDYVAVKYDSDVFPGVLEEIVPDGFVISTMIKKGHSLWKWPDKPDKIVYWESSVLGKIAEPVIFSKSRNIFSVSLDNFM